MTADPFSSKFLIYGILAVIALLLGYLALRITGNWKMRPSLQSLHSELNDARQKYAELERKYNDMQNDQTGLHKAIETLGSRIAVMEKQISGLQAENSTAYQERDRWRDKAEKLETLNTALTEQLMARNKVLDPASSKGLRAILTKNFNLTELEILAGDAGIPWEHLEGTDKASRITALLNYGERHNTTPVLLAAIKASRPDIKDLP